MDSGDYNIWFFPGLIVRPSRYSELCDGISRLYSLDVAGYCPPGVGERRDDTCDGAPESLARDAISTLPATPRAVVAHSWGCHIARRVALELDSVRAVVEIDPRIVPVRQNAAALDDIPDGFPDRASLLAAYAERGSGEDEIEWDWWEESAEGSFRLAFSRRQIAACLGAWPLPSPVDAWERLAPRAGITVVRTLGHSINSAEDFARISQLAGVTVLEAPGVHHRMGKRDQGTILQLLSAHGPLGDRLGR